MDNRTPLNTPKRSDPQTIKRWAAEHFAISIGLLRECPYHGEPFKVRQPLSLSRLNGGYPDPLDPLVRAFDGNARALYAAARRVTGDYGERCPLCAASEHDDGLD
jgi:hypothetical protein